MEPATVEMNRDVSQFGSTERRPGDGMEVPSIESYIRSASHTYKTAKNVNKPLVSTPHLSSTSKKKNMDSSMLSDTSTYASFVTPDQTLASFPTVDQISSVPPPSYEETLHKMSELNVENDTLKTQLEFFEKNNDRLTEEKMRLSQQLGIQTQVNNEVKRLLVASIGEDLEEKYGRLIADKVQVDLELQHLQNSMDQDREEVEHAMIQADVWRSKFLACRVMSEELARWKSVLYYKYRDSHSALQHLLNEHSRMRALNNATHRGLIRFAEIMKCKDPSLDSEKPLTTLDVSFMNADLVESLITIMETTNEDVDTTFEDKTKQRIHIEHTFLHKEKPSTKNSKNKEVYIEASELTQAEQLAQEIVLNPDVQSAELSRMRRDYLAHNRISHFLSTNYNATYNCCAFCKGPIYIV